MKNANLTQDKAKNSPAGGVLVGKKDGQTIIYDDGKVGGWFVGKTHKEGGIQGINKSTGQPIEVQSGEVIITAPALADQTKNEFNGKMMTNREVLSKINVDAGGVAFADGGEVPKKIKRTGASYNYGGKTMTDHEIYKYITGGHLAEGYSLREIASIHQVPLSELKEQVRLGMKAESEHTSNKREQMKIVKDHLFENPKYYTLLKKAGLKHGGTIQKESLVRDAKNGNTPARDLNNYNDVLDLEADGMVGADSGLFADGGEINLNPFLNYYFDELKDFLKSQNNIILKDDYTFYYKGENFTIEPIIVSDINTSESIKEANFIIYDIEDDIVGDIVFNPNNNKKFEANSEFFDWNNIKFEDGGDVKPYDANMEGDSAEMVFDEGGATDLPKVVSVKIDSTGTGTYSVLHGMEFSNYIDLIENLEQVFKDKNKVGSFFYFKVNGTSDRFAIAFSTRKNTVLNFNPLTGTYKDFEKQILRRYPRSAKKYDWSDFLQSKNRSGQKTPTETPTQTPTSTPASTGKPIDLKLKKIWIGDNPELAKKVLKRAKELGWSGAESEKRTCFFFTSSFLILGSNRERSHFDEQTNYEEIFESDLFETETPASTNESKGIEVTSMIIKYYGKKEEEIIANIDNVLDLKKYFDTIQKDNSTKFVYLNPIEGANPTGADGRIYLTKTPSDDEDFDTLGSSVAELKFKLKNIIFKDQNYNWNKFFDWTENENQNQNKEKVTKVNLKYRFNDKYSEVICYTIEDVKTTLDEIQEKEKHQYVDFKIITDEPALGFDKWITDFDGKNSRFDVNPKNTSLEELKKLLKDLWTDDKLDWSDFFKENKNSQTQTPTTPEPVKSNRNFELERKYLTGRINDLSKELDMKRPSLPNEEIAFYQREINKFILKLRKVMNDQNEEKPITERIEAVYGVKWGDYDKQYPKTDLVSYNGVKSELTQEEYLTVRTPEFKAFFGDWEQSSSAGYSKVINPKTKEPLAVWHGTNVLFTEWKTYATNNAHYFSTKRDFSEFFASEWESRTDKAGVDSKVLKDLNPNKGKFMFRCFIDVRNPIDFSRFGVDKRPISDYLTFLKINYNIGDYDFWTGLGNASGVTKDTKVYAWQIIRLWQNFTTYVKLYTTYDGYIFYEYNPNTPSGGLENASLCFCAFESNQVKFTNAYEFNALSNDSRFDFGGTI